MNWLKNTTFPARWNTPANFQDPSYINRENKMPNKLVYDPNKVNRKTKEKGVAFHVPRVKNLRKHRRFSHKEGDLVEWIGKDKTNRGMGIVLSECNGSGYQNGDLDPWDPHKERIIEVKDEDYTHLKIFWQVLMREEIVSKAFVRKIPDKGTGVVILQKKENNG